MVTAPTLKIKKISGHTADRSSMIDAFKHNFVSSGHLFKMLAEATVNDHICSAEEDQKASSS